MIIKNRKIRRVGRKIIDLIEKYIMNPPFFSYKKEIKKGWSFVITTYSAEKNTLLFECIKSIENMFLNESELYEIIVVGRKCKKLTNTKTIFGLNFRETGLLTGWITRKENIGIRKSRFDKVVICHDYIGFNNMWLQGFREFGDDFDVCVTKVKLRDGRRSRDWVVRDYPNIGRALLPYDVSCLEYQYINGAYFIGKRDFLISNLLDERLRSCEAEDVEWTKRISSFADIRLNIHSYVQYLKAKPSDDPPYCEEWINNTKLICELFDSYNGMEDLMELMKF